MPRRASALFDRSGTRFWVYPQERNAPGFGKAEIAYVNSPPGTIGSGPADERIAVIDSPAKPPYFSDDETVVWTPPYHDGRDYRRRPPVAPHNGHFDHVKPGHPDFPAVMPFAVVRSVLTVWESYLGPPLGWHFRDAFPRLELIPRVESRNCWSGDGFVELGYPKLADSVLGDRSDPFCENFDAVAHETGHLILKSVIGQMPNYQKSVEYRAHEEAAADLVAMVASLHFDAVADRLLAETAGMLYSVNLISRATEWGRPRRDEIRELFNRRTLAWAGGLDDVNKHVLSLPFSGAAYEAFVAIYLAHLRERGALSRALATRPVPRTRARQQALEREYRPAFDRRPDAFKEALLDARDDFGRLLAATWQAVEMHSVRYATVVAALLDAAARLRRGRYAAAIRAVFAARGITPAR
jgi:hypothetical protein